MLIQASVRALPGRPREGFLVAVDVLSVTAAESHEIALLHLQQVAGDGDVTQWARDWGTVMGAAGRYEAVVELPTQRGDRLRLRDRHRVLRDLTVDW